MYAGFCETTRNATFCIRFRPIAMEAILATTSVRSKPAILTVRHHQPERPVGCVQQPARHRHAFFFVRIEQRLVCLTFGYKCELPCQVIRILQAGVHALRTDRAVNVCSVTEQKAAAVTEACGAAVMNAVSGEPATGLEGQS